MTACKGCSKPQSGIYFTGCSPCTARRIARGPGFAESLRAGRITARYKRELAALGEGIEAAHQAVKAAAKTIVLGSIRA